VVVVVGVDDVAYDADECIDDVVCVGVVECVAYEEAVPGGVVVETVADCTWHCKFQELDSDTHPSNIRHHPSDCSRCSHTNLICLDRYMNRNLHQAKILEAHKLSTKLCFSTDRSR
jgi:hypothetical protein